MTVDRKKMIDELKSTEDPKLIQEGDFQSDNILRVISSQGGYRLEVDAFPIDGPYEISSDEFSQVAKMDEDGDDVEGLVHVIRMAMEYRQTFHTDVFIDILAYRKFGHNEGDEPRFTQPLLYKAIAKHPNPRDIYSKELVSQGVLSSAEIKVIESEYESHLENQLEASRKNQRGV